MLTVTVSAVDTVAAAGVVVVVDALDLPVFRRTCPLESVLRVGEALRRGKLILFGDLFG